MLSEIQKTPLPEWATSAKSPQFELRNWTDDCFGKVRKRRTYETAKQQTVTPTCHGEPTDPGLDQTCVFQGTGEEGNHDKAGEDQSIPTSFEDLRPLEDRFRANRKQLPGIGRSYSVI